MNNNGLLWYILYKEQQKKREEKEAIERAREATQPTVVITKADARKMMRSKEVKLGDKISLWLNLEWQGKFACFPLITTLYFLVSIPIIYMFFKFIFWIFLDFLPGIVL